MDFFYITIFSNSNYINSFSAYRSNTANIGIKKDFIKINLYLNQLFI